jgi:uncharacterized OB-fold protein
MAKKSEGDMEGTTKQIPIEEGLFYVPSSEGDEPYLIGAKCKDCGLVTFPKTPVCPRCMKKDTMEEAHLRGKGKLDTFSIVQAALPGFQAPSIQAYINLEEGPRIWSLVTGCEPSEEALKIGMDMELVIAKVREGPEGTELISYQFKPVET